MSRGSQSNRQAVVPVPAVRLLEGVVSEHKAGAAACRPPRAQAGEEPCAAVEHVYKLGDSTVVQRVVLRPGSRRLDFETSYNWKEDAAMLRTSFPVAVSATDATFEVQFGHIARPTHQNTSWDFAKDEVPAHKWADLSQRDYGVALLNDSKYGYKVKGSTLDLDLLRSCRYPKTAEQPEHAYTDQEQFHFTYSLFPHLGDHATGRVARAAYELNCPVREAPSSAPAAAGAASSLLGPAMSLLSVDTPDVIVETVKLAERDTFGTTKLVVRLYETAGGRVQASLGFGLRVASVTETNLLEQPLAGGSPLVVEAGHVVRLVFEPLQIKTIVVELVGVGSPTDAAARL